MAPGIGRARARNGGRDIGGGRGSKLLDAVHAYTLYTLTWLHASAYTLTRLSHLRTRCAVAKCRSAISGITV
eukprot:8917431-Pyramimonas_sp.AAC.1